MNKNFIKKQLCIITVTVIALAFGGCGYRMGSLMHPQVKSIAIAPITNKTLEPFVAASMRGSLCEQFLIDSSLKVKQLGDADCILYGRVIEVETVSTAEDSIDNEQTYRAAEWQVSVTFEFVVMIPGRKKPLINKRRVSGSAIYQVMADQAITRSHGVKQACQNAAEQAVIYTTEAW